MATSSFVERRPQQGDVLPYSFLWFSQAVSGREDAEKERPCVVVLAVGDGVHPTVLVAPITSRDPADPRAIPLKVGAPGVVRPSWVVPWELNEFTWPGPDVGRAPSPVGAWWRLGALAPALRNLLAERLAAELQAGRLKRTGRTE